MVKNMVKNLGALVISVLAVHLLYIGFILPNAEIAIALAESQGQAVPRNLFIIIKDLEQEICIILMLWGSYLIVGKMIAISKDRYLFDENLIAFSDMLDNNKIAVAKAAREQLAALPADVVKTSLVQTLMVGLDRFLITKDVHYTAEAIDAKMDALVLSIEAENSMIRYLIWAIPSIGFIGTVRGIGQALSQADQALAGNIAGMTNSLGIAFNSTLVALIISIFLMLLLHQLQRIQDGLIVDIRAYCETHIMNPIGKS
ncbi:MAG: MotA/TolQ/ExbB proton channel family protein [Chromatiales bacterium]|nr:MotA/TolQ/ExbB proton channel family protein [Chromatiales bacterium]